MKNWKKIAAIAVAVLIVLSFMKDFLVKTIITSVGSNVVGAPIRIGEFRLGLLTQKVRIGHSKLYNPQGFPNESMIDLPEISVEYDLGSLLSGKLHLKFLVVNLKEMTVIKNKEGKLNVDSLKVVEEGKKKSDTKEGPAQMPIQIDVMKLNVERVILKDFSKGDQPSIEVFEVALKDKTFKNITSVEQMITLVMVQAMGPTAIKSAKIYAAATILGVGFLPAGIVGVLVGKDDAKVEYKKSFDKVYATCLDLIKAKGELKSENKAAGTIKGKMQGAEIMIKIENAFEGNVQVTVSARQMLLPKPEIVGGITYQLDQILK